MDESVLHAIRTRAQALAQSVIDVRRDIHSNPELGNCERRTPALVADTLRPLGFDIREGVGGTGVVATLRGGRPGRTIALRADMDALPLNEESDHAYRSCVPGVMHACGHDGHVAMALGAARVLHELRDHLRGNVRFLFQPAEETIGGANEMIADGCLAADPPVDAVFGLHLWPLMPAGQLSLKPGPIMASADLLRIVVKGEGGHASEPHTCTDPVPVAAQVINNLQALITRRFDARSPVVVTITYMQAGSAFNIIPPEVVLGGTVRTVDPEVRAAVPARIEHLVRHTTAAFGADAEVTYIRGSGVVMNHPGFTGFVRQTIQAARGSESIHDMAQPIMGAEDFGAFLEQVPGAFAFLGARPTHQEPYPCHHPRFDIDEQALPEGVEILATVAMKFLDREAEVGG